MDEIQVNTIELNGKEYFMVDKVNDDENTYYYFSNENNKQDVHILKEKNGVNEEYYNSLDNGSEFDYALELFYKKYCEGNEI